MPALQHGCDNAVRTSFFPLVHFLLGHGKCPQYSTAISVKMDANAKAMGRRRYLGPLNATDRLRPFNPLLLLVIALTSWLFIAYGIYLIF